MAAYRTHKSTPEGKRLTLARRRARAHKLTTATGSIPTFTQSARTR